MYRNYVFTLNNPTEGELDEIKNYEATQYLIWGEEKGASGTFHYQGYVELNRPVRFTTIKNKISRAHIEPRKGSQAAAIKYCKKDNKFTEIGTPKEQGERADLDSCRSMAAEDGMTNITRICSFQQMKVAEKFLEYNEEPRTWKTHVTWIWGPTGTGKSTLARELLGPNVYEKMDDSKWWPGYDGHEDVIVDDFRDTWIALPCLLKLLDKFGYRVELKGGYRQFRARRMVITSPNHPGDYYRFQGEDIQQLLRRIEDIRHIPERCDVTEVEG